MSLLVMHLSDIHIKSADDPIIPRAVNIAKAAYAALSSAKMVVVLVSGDIAYSGSQSEYIAAEKFLREIKGELQAEVNIPVYFVPCPGNHDCNFGDDDSTRQMVLAGLQAGGVQAVDESLISTCIRIQNNYFDFADKLTSDIDNAGGDRLWKSYEFELEGKSVVFDALNVAWASQKREVQGTLSFPYSRYSNKANEQPDLRIGVLHHPLNWFGQATYRPFRDFLRGLENIVFTGHEHVGMAGENYDTETGLSAYVEGWVLQGEKDLSDSSFGLVELRLEDQTYRVTSYEWNNSSYVSADIGSWEDYRNLPAKKRNELAITEAFSHRLRDPGGAFRTAIGKEVVLEDIFIYSDMQSLDDDEDKDRWRTSALRDKLFLNEGVLLHSEEKVGATSLLFRLFESYHSTGAVPLYIRGTDLKSSSEKDVVAALNEAVLEQYGEKAINAFEQIPRSSKILLLDDFDDSSVKMSVHRSKILNYLSVRFPVSIVSVSELFSMSDLAHASDIDAFRNYRRFRLLPFGYSRRAELIRKWFQLTAADGTVSDEDFSRKCDSAEKLFDTVMVRNIIPSLPLYLLTLLQGVDAGVGGSFQDSALGQYYGFLLSESLKGAGIRPQKWDAITQYCSHLAWHVHGSGSKEIEVTKLRAFNDAFSTEQHSVDFQSRLDELLQAHILSKNGSYYCFRYHYIFYFLKGKYIAARLDNPEIQAYVKRCCDHLYARENANTLLFLAHHAYADKFFLSCIVGAMNRPFAGISEIRFDVEDTAQVSDLLAEAPKLAYADTGETPERHRAKANEERDRLDDGNDGLADCEENGNELSLAAQVAASFKSVEIIGQLLKNQYSVIPRKDRTEMLDQLMRGPLRGIHAVLASFVSDRDSVIQDLEEILEKKAKISDIDRRTQLARRILAQLLQTSACGFIIKAATSISCKELYEDIQSAVARIGTPAARLIEVAVRLDSPDPLPRELVKQLYEDIKGDVVGGQLIKMITLQRLYMFRISHEDKQWLASKEIVGVQQQNALSFRARNSTKIKSN